MPSTATVLSNSVGEIDYYEIAVQQFRQQILPPDLPETTVWSYGSLSAAGTLNYPAFTIEAKVDRPVRVKWANGLMDSKGAYLPHLLPVDPTLHWANPPGGLSGRDERPTFARTPGAYSGPVPIVTHVHGAHVEEYSDGYPETWFLPNANNIPQGFATEGSFYSEFKHEFEQSWGQEWMPGTAVFQYPNRQRATTLWYHDHTLGMTRLNVYAGPAGFFLIRGGDTDVPAGILPGPAPSIGDPPGMSYYEIPIAIQDRSFNRDGSLFYPDSRVFFDGFEGPYIPDSDIAPIFNPEFFGNTMVVNGRTWPFLEVEPRRYRFRFLNGCNSRFLILKLTDQPLKKRPVAATLPFWVIGTEGGFLPQPVQIPQLLMGLAERFDAIVDFTGLRPGTELYLVNEAPDEPFGGGNPGEEFEPSDKHTTGQVMKFRVVPLKSADTSTPPDRLTLPTFTSLGGAQYTRKVSLNEKDSAVLEEVGPRAAFLGTVDENGNPEPMMWGDMVTENPSAGATEIWELYNFTADAHPIHVHQVQFQVINRQQLRTDSEGIATAPAELVGSPLSPESWESGYKDTLIVYPGAVTRIKVRFDIPGRFVWHCHIVEHEDNEMMRPIVIGT
ncbi:MAG TPA: multicopper oxidase [Terriglobales bacterium]|jgi:bilirubin oxidase|nr:multicopper oxidase [Terriglobales bacterium]